MSANLEADTESQLPLFVFGTLRRGERNHHYLAGRYDSQVPAILPGFSRVPHPLYPMIGRDPAGEVTGELYFLTPKIYAETMRCCDELEEIPILYRRLAVMVETDTGSFLAWAYVHPETETL